MFAFAPAVTHLTSRSSPRASFDTAASVVTQLKSHSLLRHLQRGWNFLRGEANEFIDLLPAQQRVNESFWYRGTAAAVFQNIDILRGYNPEYILVLAGDHIYKQDYWLMLRDHAQSGSRCTVGCVEEPRMEATALGVMAIDDQRRITSFLEKPADPPAMPGKPDRALGSMGIYVFDADYLYEMLDEDLTNAASDHDFGKNIIPRVVANGQALAHPLNLSSVPWSTRHNPYWRDLGTVDAFWAANLDLASNMPELNIYDREWPIWTYQEQLAPAKFVPSEKGHHGETANVMVSGGCIVSGSDLHEAVLFSGVRIHSCCRISQAVLLPDCDIGRGCRLPQGMVIGEDAELDAQRFYCSETGVVLVTRAMLEKLAA